MAKLSAGNSLFFFYFTAVSEVCVSFGAETEIDVFEGGVGGCDRDFEGLFSKS